MSWSDTFTSFDTGDWTLYADAKYNSTGDYVKLNESGGTSDGGVQYDYGIGSDDFNVQFTFEITNDGGDMVQFWFYGNAITSEANFDDGYWIDYNHYDNQIRLNEQSNGSTTTLKSVSQTIGAAKHTGTVDYNAGTVTVSFNGTQMFQYTISSPTKYGTGVSWKAWDGGATSDHYLHDVTIAENLNNPSGVGQTVNANDSIDVSWTDNAWKTDNFRVNMSRDGAAYTAPSGGDTTPTASPATYTANSDSSYDSVVGMDSSFKWRVSAENRHGNSGWAHSGTEYTEPVPPHNPSADRPDSKTVDLTWTVQSDIAEGTRVFIREDTGSGYGTWGLMDTISGGEAHIISGTPGSKGSTVTVRYKADTSYQNTATFTTDSRVQFRIVQDNFTGSVTSDVVYTDYGNNGNVFFTDDFEDNDLAEWTTSFADADSGIVTGSVPNTGVSGPDEGSYHLRLDSSDYVETSLGDLSTESNVIVKCAIAVGTIESGSPANIYWYDGSSYTSIASFDAEYNRQGYMEVTTLVPSSLLTTNTKIRIRGRSGDNLAVDRVVVSDVLHEYTEPAAPSGVSLDTSVEDEITATWTDNASLESNYEYLYKKTSSTTWNKVTNQGANSTSATQGGLLDGEAYDFKIRPVIAQYRNGAKLNVWYIDSPIATGTTVLPAPTLDSLTPSEPHYLDAAWTDNADNEDGFRVYYSTDGGTTWTQYNGDLAANTVSATLDTLSHDTTYDVKVEVFTEHVNSESTSLTATTFLDTTRGAASHSSPMDSDAFRHDLISLELVDFDVTYCEHCGEWHTDWFDEFPITGDEDTFGLYLGLYEDEFTGANVAVQYDGDGDGNVDDAVAINLDATDESQMIPFDNLPMDTTGQYRLSIGNYQDSNTLTEIDFGLVH